MYFFLAFLFARYSPFYLCLFLFYFAFPSPYPAYFGVLSNFLVRFSQLVLRLLLLVLFFVALSLSFHPIFTQNPLSTNLNYDKALSLPVFLVCELIRNCKRLRITVQLQPHQFNFPLKTRVAHYFLTRLHVYYPK